MSVAEVNRGICSAMTQLEQLGVAIDQIPVLVFRSGDVLLVDGVPE